MPPASTARVSLPDRYRVVRHLANGGMASVWEAHDELLHRSVAVKVLAPHLSEDLSARARFQREARAAAGLSSHPNVVTIYDVGDHDGQVFMVMELMRGGSVANRLRAGEKIPRETALRWLGEAAAALDAAHAAGVIHRDVKPANLLLDGHDRLAIADFGIARVAETTGDQLTATGQVLGTAAYISPEQAMGEPAVAASDRYGLAVVAYELLTGSRPFRAEHFAAQARAHVEDRPEPPSLRRPGLPREVDAVLARGLAKDPSARWPTATEMIGRLEDALEEPPTEATRPLAGAVPPGDRVGPPPAAAAPVPDRARRPAGALLLVGLAGLALLAVLAVVLFATGGSDTNSPTKRAANPPSQAKKQPSHKRHRKPTPTPTARATETTTPSPTASASPSPSPSPTRSGGGLAKASSLQLQGFNARKAGDYARGLTLSKQALAACGDTHALDPCGYALYEIGADLIGLGQPQAAIPYLQRRLDEYGDNSGGEVRKALEQAQGQAGGGSSGSGGGDKGHGKSKDKSGKD